METDNAAEERVEYKIKNSSDTVWRGNKILLKKITGKAEKP